MAVGELCKHLASTLDPGAVAGARSGEAAAALGPLQGSSTWQSVSPVRRAAQGWPQSAAPACKAPWHLARPHFCLTGCCSTDSGPSGSGSCIRRLTLRAAGSTRWQLSFLPWTGARLRVASQRRPDHALGSRLPAGSCPHPSYTPGAAWGRGAWRRHVGARRARHRLRGIWLQLEHAKRHRAGRLDVCGRAFRHGGGRLCGSDGRQRRCPSARRSAAGCWGLGSRVVSVGAEGGGGIEAVGATSHLLFVPPCRKVVPVNSGGDVAILPAAALCSLSLAIILVLVSPWILETRSMARCVVACSPAQSTGRVSGCPCALGNAAPCNKAATITAQHRFLNSTIQVGTSVANRR
jgi:hypothetical protein